MNSTSNILRMRIVQYPVSLNLVPSSFSFVLILKGEVFFQTEGYSDHMNEDDVLLLSPGEIWRIQGEQGNLCILLEIDYSFLTFSIPNIQTIACNTRRESHISFSSLRRAIANIAKHYYSDEKGRHLRLYETIYAFMSILFDATQIAERNDTAQHPMVENGSSVRIQEIKEYLADNYAHAIRLDDLAKRFYLTPQYMSKYFRDHVGTTFSEYLTSIRLNRATKDLLLTGNAITKIAYNCGFSSTNAFNKAFRAAYGQTPTSWRDAHRLTETLEADGRELTPDLGVSPVMAHLTRYASSDSASVQNLSQIQIAVPAEHTVSGKTKKAWQKIINVGRAENVLSFSMNEHLMMAQQQIGFEYARITNVVSKDTIYLMPDGQFNFSKFNKIVDFLLEQNIIPFFEISDRPFTIYRAPESFVFNLEDSQPFVSSGEWSRFLQKLLTHCINRYGTETVEKWVFEQKAAHNAFVSYDQDDVEAYANRFKVTYNAIKQVLPMIQVGGPCFNIAAPIEQWHYFMNAYQKTDIFPDFISMSAFHVEVLRDCNSAQGSYTHQEDYLEKKIAPIGKLLRNKHVKMYITEWNFGYTSRNALNDSIFKATFIVRNAIRMQAYVDGFGFWFLSDLISEYQDTSHILHGGSGLLTIDGIRKPSFFAFTFLEQLGNHIIDSNDSFVVASNGVDEHQVLLYHYGHPESSYFLTENAAINYENLHQLFSTQDAKVFDITLQPLTSGYYRITEYCLDHNNGSILDKWKTTNALDDLTQNDVEYLQAVSRPGQSTFKVEKTSVENLLRTLQCNEMRLMRIKRIN